MLEYYKKNTKNNKLIKIPDCSKNCWINVVDPDDKEIKTLISEFNLDEGLLHDALDLNEVPRIEERDKNVYVYLRIPTFKIENEYTASFLTIITEESFITISDKRLELFERLLKTRNNFYDNNPTKALLELLFILSSKYSHWIRYLSKEVKKNRRNIKKLDEKAILELVLQEDTLNDYFSSLEPLIHIHGLMLKSKCLKFKESEKDFIEDLISDLNQTLNSCELALKIITNMRDYYSTTLSNNRNEILRVLTIFTIFLTVPMVLSGLYGMNVTLPIQEYKEAFWILIGMIMFVWGVAIVALKKLRVI